MRPALPRLVDVAPGERLQLADAHPRRVEHERRQAVASGEEADDGLNVRGYGGWTSRRSSHGSFTVSRSRAGFG
jgi:hypothetical protein